MRLTLVHSRQEDCGLYPVEARIYALRELAHRAGVSDEMFRTWRIEANDGFLTAYVKPGSHRRIRIPQAPDSYWSKIQAGFFRTTIARWMSPVRPAFDLVPDFRVPFTSVDSEEVGSLFHARSEECVECTVDLLASILLTLSRFEETLPQPRDTHGRFSAFSGIAWRDNFLHRPVVDEYGLAFAEALALLLPGWQPEPRSLRVMLGHDVDQIGVPFSLRTTVAHTLRRRRPSASIRDVAALASGADTTYQYLLRRLVNFALRHGLNSAVYWKASRCGLHDTGYDPRHPRIRGLIETFREQGVEMGIHLSYAAADSLEQFKEEVSGVRELLGQERLGGRQDFLRWNPQAWEQWDDAGLAYDASVGYADYIGFRAGTAYPYFPWLQSHGRPARLLEIPLLAMDSTLKDYMKLSPERTLEALRHLIARCRVTGGVFTLLWHNTTLMDAGYERAYRTLLDELAESEPFNWAVGSHATP